MSPGDFDAYASTGGAGEASRVSTIVEVLEEVWEGLRRRWPELPPVAMVVASGSEAQKVKRWGHWAAGRWVLPGGDRRGEVFIAAERLGHGPVAVLETLLHEAAHALASVRALTDTSRQGRYHNDTYRLMALEVGLHVDRDKRDGWNLTRIADTHLATFEPELGRLEGRLHGYRAEAAEPERERKRTGGGDRLLAVCGCPEPRKLRVSRSTLDEGDIWCGVCGETFQEQDLTKGTGA